MRAMLLLLLGLLAGPPDPAPDPPEARIRALVRELAAESWETRDRAYRRLRALGETAHPYLEEALDDADLEIRRATSRLLREARTSEDRGLRRRLRDRAPKFTDTDSFRDLVARGEEIVPLLLDVVRQETRSATQYDYTTLRNAYAILGRLVEDGKIGPDRLAVFLALLDSPNSQTRHLGRPILRKLAAKQLPGILRRAFDRPGASADLRANLLHLIDLEGADGAAALLPDALRDEAPALRLAAAGLMARRGREEHLPLLLERAADPVPEVRAAILRALQRYPESRETRSTVGVALGDPDGLVRRAAVEAAAAITMHTSDRSLVPAVRKLLASGDPTVVQSAANVVARVRDRDATPLLLPLLEHEDEEFRRQILVSTILALGRIADPAAREPLERFLRDADQDAPRNRSARVYAVQALLRITGEEAIGFAEALLAEDEETAPQILIQTLSEVPGRKRIPLLLRALDHGNRFVIANAALGLGRAGASEAAPKLVALLESEDRYLRQSLLQALGALASPAAGPGLLAFVEEKLDEEDDSTTSDVYHVRLAIEALGACAHRPAEKTLIRILRHQNRFLAPTAVALSRLGGSESRSALQEVAEGQPGSSTTGRIIAAALARLGDATKMKAIHESDLAAIDTEDPAPFALARAADSAIRLGLTDDALRLAKRRLSLEPDGGHAHYDLACILALSDQLDLALETLEKARARGYRNVQGLLSDPDLSGLRDRQEFWDLAARMSRQ